MGSMKLTCFGSIYWMAFVPNWKWPRGVFIPVHRFSVLCVSERILQQNSC